MALRLLQQAVTGSSSVLEQSAYQTARALSSYTFSGLADAPPAAGSSNIQVSVSGDAKAVSVDVKAGRASAKASYAPNSIKKLQSFPVTLYDAARVSVLHASMMEYLLRLAHARYSLLAQWPDFTTMMGKDYYYRSHPEEVRKFYKLVDEFHRMWDVVTEFDSLSHLATQMVPAYRKRRMNVLGPAVSPTVANGVVTQFLLAKAQ
uniref:Uncharacterized protein n=1 Tax=Tetradesmus obliquus TaxID=3088 RepID=A0A383VZS9_TETOB|eukprot:jgi/Sobl393_1/2201/SZX70430.1